MSDLEIIKEYYNSDVEHEWNRLEHNSYEFLINTHFMDKYIKSGDKILDIGGGPGRYSLYFAQKECDVTLIDLSVENVKFAINKANELGVELKAIEGNACNIESIVEDKYDHVFLMGPLYHLLKEADRKRAVRGSLEVLKPNGLFYASFITSYAGIIYLLREDPTMINDPELLDDFKCFEEDRAFSGMAFTEARFERIWDAVPFMNKFNLQKLHLIGSESILAPFKHQVMNQPELIFNKLVELAIKVCEREDLLSYSEHLLYIGRKI